ncbi:unnamed protein product, partial [Heterotrigona itama]
MQVSFTERDSIEYATRWKGGAQNDTRCGIGVIVTGHYKTTKWGVTAVTAMVEVRRTRERMARDLSSCVANNFALLSPVISPQSDGCSSASEMRSSPLRDSLPSTYEQAFFAAG